MKDAELRRQQRQAATLSNGTPVPVKAHRVRPTPPKPATATAPAMNSSSYVALSVHAETCLAAMLSRGSSVETQSSPVSKSAKLVGPARALAALSKSSSGCEPVTEPKQETPMVMTMEE